MNISLEPSNKQKTLHLSIIILPVIIFFVYIYKNAVNVPYMDDVELIFTVNTLHDKSIFSTLFAQQNDHRILFARLGAIFSYYLSNDVDFRNQQLLGFSCFLFLIYSFYLSFKITGKQLIFFLPVVLLLCNPIVWRVILWTITAFQSPLAIGFSFVSLHFLGKDSKQWYWSILFAIFSSLTILDGLSILPLGVLWLISLGKYKRAIIFSLFSVFYLVIFFQNYHFSDATHFSFDFGIILKNFVGFVGGFTRVFSDSSLVIPQIIGLLMIVFFLAIKISEWRKGFSTNGWLSFIDICLIRLLASGMMIALGRSPENGSDIITDRYQVYIICILAMFYLFILGNITKGFSKSIVFWAISFALVINIAGYIRNRLSVEKFVEEQRVDAFNFRENKIFLYQFFNQKEPDSTFFRAYHAPRCFQESCLRDWKNSLLDSAKNTSTDLIVNQLKQNDRFSDSIYPWVRLVVTFNAKDILDSDLYIGLLRTDTKSPQLYLAVLSPSQTNWFREVSSSDTINYEAIIPMKLPKGKYNIGLCRKEGQVVMMKREVEF
jgi:hypothetical protein